MKADLKKGFAQVANGLSMALATAGLSGREASVIFFIIRKTYGWSKKWTDPGTAMELVEKTMSKSSVCLAISVLLERKIVKQDDLGRWSINSHIDEWQPSSPLDGKESNRPAHWTPPSSPLDAPVQPTGRSTDEPKERIKKERKTDSGETPQEAQAKPREPKPFHVFMDRYLAECLDLKPGEPTKQNQDKVGAAYRRYGKAGRDVLAMSDGDPEKAISTVHAIGYHLQSRGLSWTLDTIAKHALDYYQNPKAYGGGNGRR